MSTLFTERSLASVPNVSSKAGFRPGSHHLDTLVEHKLSRGGKISNPYQSIPSAVHQVKHEGPPVSFLLPHFKVFLSKTFLCFSGSVSLYVIR